MPSVSSCSHCHCRHHYLFFLFFLPSSCLPLFTPVNVFSFFLASDLPYFLLSFLFVFFISCSDLFNISETQSSLYILFDPSSLSFELQYISYTNKCMQITFCGHWKEHFKRKYSPLLPNSSPNCFSYKYHPPRLTPFHHKVPL